jgi:glycogen(starch) synthase
MDFGLLEPYTWSTMKVLMLGWEYPPHIAGGLGTACEGLTAALAAQGVSVHFVVPQFFGGERVEHMLFSSAASGQTLAHGVSAAALPPGRVVGGGSVERSGIPAFLTPYWNQSSFAQAVEVAQKRHSGVQPLIGDSALSSHVAPIAPRDGEDPIAQAIADGEIFGVSAPGITAASYADHNAAHVTDPSTARAPREYSPSILSEVERFTADIVSRFSDTEFDIIHAHDWMTFPAGVALAKGTGRPLVVHVHSLEYDRSGVFYDENINAIERFGLQSADRVIAVSHYTKNAIEKYHGIAPKKISVVHNGTYPKQLITEYRHLKTWPRYVVLFLGRVTYQKGPEYFVEVAKKVVPHLNGVLFVLAGDGDLLPAVRERVSQLQLDDHFLFPGFVQGEELEELFSVADLYVMPSVSEPFGLAALEAISFETPVLLSKQSGVAEVITSALKVDFWDTDRMADLIINALTHHELRCELVEKAKQEVAALHWGAAATKTMEVYNEVCSSERAHVGKGHR